MEECVHDVSREGAQLMGGEVSFFMNSRLSAVVEEGVFLMDEMEVSQVGAKVFSLKELSVGCIT